MPCLLTDQYFANNFWKRSPKEPKEHFYEIISKSDQWFQKRRILKNFSEIQTVQKAPPPPPPPPAAMFFRRIRISQTLFEKGHPRNNLVKLFQNLTSGFRGEDFWRISLKSTHSEKSLPPMAAILFDGSWPVVRRACVYPCVRPSVNFFFKHLLWNHLSDFDEISQKCSLKEFDSFKHSGCHSNKTYFFSKSLKIFLSETITPRATEFGM